AIAQARQAQAAETALRLKSEEAVAMTQQLWQAAKLATVGELAASIAHEINNPLQTVSLHLESAVTELAADNPLQPSLRVIEQETERMAALVTSLLQFSRRSAQQISTID